MAEAKNEEVLWCAFCNGSGRYGLNKEKICPACSGVGKSLAPEKWVWCSFCGGSGKDPRGRSANNPLQSANPPEPCPACGGRGRAKTKNFVIANTYKRIFATKEQKLRLTRRKRLRFAPSKFNSAELLLHRYR